MNNEIQHFIAMLTEKQNLSREQAAHAFQIIMNGGATPAQMGAFLMGLRDKGETIDEITGGAETMRMKMTPLHAPAGTIDVCGTGGDARGTLNISTAVALVVAACGVPVAKHGNRAISSKSGSSDVLSALGVKVDAPIPALEKSLRECHICFMLAPRFHPAMRHVAPVRVELGVRTIFNILGPICNPASPALQLLGVYSRDLVEPMAQVLKNLGATRAWVVHGEDGLDELTTTGTSYVAELRDGKIKTFEIVPEDAGLERAEMKSLKGEDAEHNAQYLRHLLQGTRNAYRDIVLLNAAAALVVAGKTDFLTQGVAIAADAIDSGRAKQTLATLAYISNEQAA